MEKFDKYILGETDDDVQIETSEDNRIATLRMTEQASRSIDIISRNLDPAIYNTPEFVEAAKQLVLKSKKNRIRILTNEPNVIVKRGHRLVDLALDLSSYIEIKVPAPEHAQMDEQLLVLDETGYIYRGFSERYEGRFNFNDKRASRLFMHEFDEIWEKARPDPNFKRALL
jgi:hypothetical protein